MTANNYDSPAKNERPGVLGWSALTENIASLFRLSLYRNAIFLMLNSAMYGLTGFFFWILAARLYSPAVVGLASSVISSIGLLSLLSTLGLDYGLLRFLPTAGELTADMINTCFTIVGIITLLTSVVYVAGLSIWAPALLPIRNNLLYFISFVVFALANSLQLLNNQCFIAARQSRFAMIQGWIIAWLRFLPLVLLATAYPQFGIVAAWGLCVVLSVTIAINFFHPIAYPGNRPIFTIKKDVINRLLHFSFANYVGNIFWMLPSLILPIMVVNRLGAEQNAYFYVSWATFSMVYGIPMAISLSLLAEASHDEAKLVLEMKRSLKLIFLLLTPVVIALLFLSRTFLQFFGKAYSDNALQLLWILVVSAIPMSLNFVYITVRQVEKKMASVIFLSGLLTLSILVSSFFLLPAMGIKGAGLGVLASQSMAALFTIPYLWRRLYQRV